MPPTGISDAIRSWKRSLALRPDAQVQKYLEKAEQDAKRESDFTQKESNHFTLKYEGTQTPESLRRDLVSTLESHYDDLVRDLGVAPRGSICGDSLHRSGFLRCYPVTLLGGRSERRQTAHPGEWHDLGHSRAVARSQA